MHIILGEENARQLEDKYTVLELDTFRIQGNPAPVKSYCVVEQIPIMEISHSDQFRNLHNDMIRNFKLKNWKFCEDALEHLIGKWHGEVDSFYNIMARRVEDYKAHDPGPEWDGTYFKI